MAICVKTIYRTLAIGDDFVAVVQHPETAAERARALGAPQPLAEALRAHVESRADADPDEPALAVAMSCVDLALAVGLELQAANPDACHHQMLPHAPALAAAMVSCPERGLGIRDALERAIGASRPGRQAA
jgi:hypothetical protein